MDESVAHRRKKNEFMKEKSAIFILFLFFAHDDVRKRRAVDGKISNWFHFNQMFSLTYTAFLAKPIFPYLCSPLMQLLVQCFSEW